MAYYSSLSVSVGAYTKASDYNHVADSVDWLQTQGDVGHDLDTATGDGYHRATYTQPLICKAAADRYGSLWLDDTDPANIVWRTKTGTSAAAVTPGAKTEGVAFALGN